VTTSNFFLSPTKFLKYKITSLEILNSKARPSVSTKSHGTTIVIIVIIVDSELERISKEAVTVQSRYYHCMCLGVLGNTTKNQSVYPSVRSRLENRTHRCVTGSARLFRMPACLSSLHQ